MSSEEYQNNLVNFTIEVVALFAAYIVCIPLVQILLVPDDWRHYLAFVTSFLVARPLTLVFVGLLEGVRLICSNGDTDEH